MSKEKRYILIDFSKEGEIERDVHGVTTSEVLSSVCSLIKMISKEHGIPFTEIIALITDTMNSVEKKIGDASTVTYDQIKKLKQLLGREITAEAEPGFWVHFIDKDKKSIWYPYNSEVSREDNVCKIHLMHPDVYVMEEIDTEGNHKFIAL